MLFANSCKVHTHRYKLGATTTINVDHSKQKVKFQNEMLTTTSLVCICTPRNYLNSFYSTYNPSDERNVIQL